MADQTVTQVPATEPAFGDNPVAAAAMARAAVNQSGNKTPDDKTKVPVSSMASLQIETEESDDEVTMHPLDETGIDELPSDKENPKGATGDRTPKKSTQTKVSVLAGPTKAPGAIPVQPIAGIPVTSSGKVVVPGET